MDSARISLIPIPNATESPNSARLLHQKTQLYLQILSHKFVTEESNIITTLRRTQARLRRLDKRLATDRKTAVNYDYLSSDEAEDDETRKDWVRKRLWKRIRTLRHRVKRCKKRKHDILLELKILKDEKESIEEQPKKSKAPKTTSQRSLVPPTTTPTILANVDPLTVHQLVSSGNPVLSHSSDNIECVSNQMDKLSVGVNSYAALEPTERLPCEAYKLSSASLLIREHKIRLDDFAQPPLWSLPLKPVIQPITYVSSVRHDSIATGLQDPLLLSPSSTSSGSVSPFMLSSPSLPHLTMASDNVINTTEENGLTSTLSTNSFLQPAILNFLQPNISTTMEGEIAGALQQSKRQFVRKFSIVDRASAGLMVRVAQKRNSW